MKKILIFMLVGLLMLSFTACLADDKEDLEDTSEKFTEDRLTEPTTNETTSERSTNDGIMGDDADGEYTTDDKMPDNGIMPDDSTAPSLDSEQNIDLTDAENINQSTVVDENNIKVPTTERQASEKVLLGEAGGSLITGLKPLESIKYDVIDPNNTAGLSTKMISHSHGPASNSEPHHTVVAFQKTFDKYGAYTLDTTAKDKSIYLTFDCGYEHNNLTSKVLDVLKEKNVKAAFFCTLDHIKSEPELIARMIKEGHIVGNHSNTHPSFAEISRTKMVDEIQTTENYLRENFGYAAKFFRCPKGEYNESSLDLVNSLGYTNVFWSVAYNDWDTNNIQGAEYATNTVISRLHDGAIILLHSVSQDNANALGSIIDKARDLGYEFKSLEQL